MKKNFLFRILPGALFILLGFSAFAQRPVPSKSQLDWHEQEFYLFFHFGPNTFTGREWGHGNEPESIFNPEQLDTDQWCRIARDAGAKGVIITAKHHDGFCLWPSRYSTHTVAQSPWRQGKGDVLRDLSESCKKFGLKFGVYISPWDRNHPAYGTAAYNDVYVNTMKEIFANYGPIWELWWDGANGEGPNGRKQQYDFPLFEKTIRDIAPSTVIFSDIGPDIRWVGNEKGIAGTTNWNTLDTAGFTRGEGGPSTDTLNSGNASGRHWIPAECDVSIRPGWFYHREEDSLVKSPATLFNLYLKSVGRGANLLLNVPPDSRGLIHANDSAALMGFRDLRRLFQHNLASKATPYYINPNGKQRPAAVLTDGKTAAYEVLQAGRGSLGIRFGKPETINALLLQEELSAGQACQTFSVILKNGNTVVKEIKGTTIGRKRILSFDACTITEAQLIIHQAHFPVRMAEMGAFKIPDELTEKQ